MAKGKSASGAPSAISSATAVKKARKEGKIAGTQARKVARRQKQEEAEARNKLLRVRGELTPWQKAKVAAKARKATAKGNGTGTGTGDAK